MKSDNLLRHIAAPLGIALLVYIFFYTWIEHRRTYKGPWLVTFTNDASGAAALIVNEPKLAITNLEIIFSSALEQTNTSANKWEFSQPREVPFNVPFGKCVFMDTTFLPGTLVFDIAGHEVQLIPRVLTIDGKEIPWGSNETLQIPNTNASMTERKEKQ